MLILSIRTDRPEAEIGLYDEGPRIAHETWLAHRELAETIHLKIKDLLESRQKILGDVDGIAVFQGPGSFTGLRIGISVANALADSLGIPIYGSKGDEWTSKSLVELQSGSDLKTVIPEYGAQPRITKPKR
ncbi:MAG TPA: tRNA (adenosine(37)-N6)-threonylcarbamoyltransferase complex dimerization subunit type 1 TsaB [Candidatus Saccharimonadales bacterium]|nr:tRNA (adenosine(37)-N6)-threonylcarbamoyltransferase complex dimerization subunit type 1 TsaB [Candidatus Saccharimonadales bacterium]